MSEQLKTLPQPPALFFKEFSDDLVDQIEVVLARMPQCDAQLTHRYSPGLYSREVTMPAGSVCVTLTHKTDHQFAVMSGEAIVWSKNGGLMLVKAGTVGRTTPGERRVFFVRKELKLITFHPTDQTDPDKWLAEATEHRDLSHVKEIDPFILAMFEQPKGQPCLP